MSNTYPNATHYSEHFSRREMNCRCGCKTPASIEANLAKLASGILEPLRSKAGRPVIINCAYRCPRHNTAIGGAKASQHLTGSGADLMIRGLSPQQVYAMGALIPAVGGGKAYISDGFTHLDNRPRVAGCVVTW